MELPFRDPHGLDSRKREVEVPFSVDLERLAIAVGLDRAQIGRSYVARANRSRFAPWCPRLRSITS
ncbi:MAG: hypothetical protein JST59_22030 [Actinobacteria bacterium]|nr:hypothetical protein [Actinomycetota bacterium]